MEGTLREWTVAALAIVRRTLEASPDGMSHVSSSSSNISKSSRGRSSGSGSKRRKFSGEAEVDATERSRPARPTSVLRRVLSLGRRESEGLGQDLSEDATDTEEHHKQAVREGPRGDATTSATGDNARGNEDEGAAGSSPPAQPRPGEEGVQEAEADLAELWRDAQEEKGEGVGMGLGQEGQGESDVIGALLETSEKVVAAVETKQKVSRIPMCPASADWAVTRWLRYVKDLQRT